MNKHMQQRHIYIIVCECAPAIRLQSSLYSRFDSELGDGAGDGEPGNGEPGDSVGDGEPGDGELGDGELGDGELGDGAVDRRRAVDRDER